jgi:hypothetical protein
MSASETELKQRQKHAVVLLVKAIFDQLDEVAAIKRGGGAATLSVNLLKEMCSVLPELDEELQEFYFKALPTLAADLPVRNYTTDQELVEYGIPAKERFLAQVRQDLAA